MTYPRPRRRLGRALLILGLAAAVYGLFVVRPALGPTGLLRRADVYGAGATRYSFHLERSVLGREDQVVDGRVEPARAEARLAHRGPDGLISDGALIADTRGMIRLTPEGDQLPTPLTPATILGELPLEYALTVLRLAEEPTQVADATVAGERCRVVRFRIGATGLDPLRERPLGWDLDGGQLVGEVALDAGYRVRRLTYELRAATGQRLGALDLEITYPAPQP